MQDELFNGAKEFAGSSVVRSPLSHSAVRPSAGSAFKKENGPPQKIMVLGDWIWLCAQSLRCIRLFATPCTVAHQTPLFIGFPRQEYWSVLPFPSPGDLPDPGIKLASLHWQVESLPLNHRQAQIAD